MALVLKDRVKETTTSTGTGTITLAGASTGFQSFSVIGNGNATYYTIYDPVTGAWEVGVGTYTASGTTLSRDTVLESSNSGSLVPFGAGVKDVFVTYPAERSVYLDTAGSAVTVLDIGTLGVSTANISSANITAGTISTTPTASNDLVNKTYVDGIAAQGISYHTPVKYEVPNTTGNLNATYNQPGGPGVGVGATLTNAGTLAAFAPDGPTASPGDRILVYNQTNAFENGVYTVTTVGNGSTPWVLTRASDADTYGVKSPTALGGGDAFFVTSGNTGAGETYVCNNAGTITFGTTGITFAQIASAQVYSAGAGLTLSNLVFSITPVGTAGTYGGAASVPVFTTNAYGQITGVTPTAIAISGAAVSGNIAGSAGSVANALTAGTYLTATGTFDGSVARTFSVDATSANTASKVVARDASGNFSAGTITATLSGNATTATTATNIAGGAANQIHYQSGAGTTTFVTAPTTSSTYLGWNGSAFTWSAFATPNSLTFNNGGAGGASGSTFNGSSALTVSYNTVGAPSTTGTNATGTWGISISGNAATATSATSATTATNLAGGSAGTVPYQSAAGTTAMLAAGTAGQYLQSNGAAAPSWATLGNGTLSMAVSGTGLSGSASFTANQSGNSTFTVTSNATNANTASTIVARDASGNFSAGTITAALTGTASGNLPLTGGTLTGVLDINNTAAAPSGGNSLTLGAGVGYKYIQSWASTPLNLNPLGNAVQITGNVALHAGNYNSYALPLSGGTMTGTIYSNVGSIIIGQNGGVTRGYLYNDSGGFGFLNSGGSWQAYVPYGTSYFVMNGSARSPLFYDSDNTAYYVDPASVSNLFRLSIADNTANTNILDASGNSFQGVNVRLPGRLIAGSSGGGYPGFGYNAVPTSTGLQYYAGDQAWWINYGNSNSLSFWFAPSGSGGTTISSSTRLGYFDTSANFWSTTSARAPIFYDSNNTAYYVDPASTSVIGSAEWNGSLTFTGTSGSQAINLASYNGYVSMRVVRNNAASGFNDGMYIGYANSNSGVTRIFGGGATSGDLVKYAGYTEEPGSFRAPLFYDSNNTAYYVDPVGTSYLTNAQLYSAAANVSLSVGRLGDAIYYNNILIYSGYNASTYTQGWGQDYEGCDYNFTSALKFKQWTSGTTFTERGRFDGSGNLTVNTSSRAPIFYDSDNTGYYMNPAGTSYTNVIQSLYLSNVYGVSTDHQYGIYFDSALSTAYAIYRQAGAWTHPYPDLHIAFHTGIKIGANASYQGVRFYTDYDMVTQVMSVNNASDGLGAAQVYVNNSLQAGSSLRAPIFYDSDNTAYYVDPASGSRMSNITYDNLYFSGDSTYGLYGRNGYLDTLNGRGSDALELNYYDGGPVKIGSGAYGSKDLYAAAIYGTIFYDSNNTAYYVDPAGTSSLNNTVVASAISSTSSGLRNIFPQGGTYVTGSSVLTGAIKITLPTTNYPMLRFTVKVYTYDGLSFEISCGGHTSSGVWYNTFAYMVTQNRPALNVRFTYGGGQTFVYIGELGSTWSYPQIFITDVQVGYSTYDYTQWDDGWAIAFDSSSYQNISSTHTVYPPTSSSNNTNPAYASAFYDASNTGYYLDGNTSSAWRIGTPSGYLDIGPMNSGFCHFQTDRANFYFAQQAQFDGNAIDYSGNWALYDGYGIHNSSFRAPLFYDSSNTAYYVDPASTSNVNQVNLQGYLRRNTSAAGYLEGNYPTSTDGHSSACIYTIGGAYQPSTTNLGNMYGVGYTVGNGTANPGLGLSGWGFYVASGGTSRVFLDSDNGIVISSGSARAPIFYDSNNTSYYLDPAGTSFLTVVSASRFYAGWDSGVSNSISCSNWFRSDGATGWYNNSYTGGIYMIDTTWVRVYNSKAFYVENQIAATGNVTAYYSDERLKTKVGRIENALDKVRSLEGFLYVNNDLAKANGYTSDRVQVALSAQQVQRVQPEVVSLAPFDMHTDEFSGEITSKSGENYLTVDYERLVPLLVEAIKELSAKVDALH